MSDTNSSGRNPVPSWVTDVLVVTDADSLGPAITTPRPMTAEEIAEMKRRNPHLFEPDDPPTDSK
jgi:hypothetical protein